MYKESSEGMSPGKAGKRKPRGYLWAMLHQKCPRCREGDMFRDKNPYHLKKLFLMPDKCPLCSQKMEIEVGFYFGTAYVSYALTVAFSCSTFVAWWVLIGFSLHDSRIFWWLGINACLMLAAQPFLMRLSRALWLSLFVKFSRNWQEEELLSSNATPV
jgi:hypothetical protein